MTHTMIDLGEIDGRQVKRSAHNAAPLKIHIHPASLIFPSVFFRAFPCPHLRKIEARTKGQKFTERIM